jgi:hypothetical protein
MSPYLYTCPRALKIIEPALGACVALHHKERYLARKKKGK